MMSFVLILSTIYHIHIHLNNQKSPEAPANQAQIICYIDTIIIRMFDCPFPHIPTTLNKLIYDVLYFHSFTANCTELFAIQ